MAALVPLPELWLMRDRFLEMRSCCSAALCPSSVHQSCPLPIGPAIGQLLVPQGTSIMIGIVCGSSPAPPKHSLGGTTFVMIFLSSSSDFRGNLSSKLK